MDQSTRSQLGQELWKHRDAVAGHWYQAIAQTCYVPMSAEEVRQHLIELTDLAIEFLLAELPEDAKAQEIGVTLARLHYLQPEALGRTIGVLSLHLTKSLPAGQVVALQSRLAALVEGISTGFFRQGCRIILTEQEGIREALVAELRAVEQALRKARDQLEERVRARTEDLVRTNEELRIEIAERKRTTEALQESEEKYRMLLESVQDGVYTLDMEGRFTYVNDVILERSGRSLEWFIGRSYLDVIRPEDRELARRNFEAVMRGETVPIYELAYPTASGDELWVELNTAALREQGRIIGLHGISRNITKRKQAEAALQASEEAFRQFFENIRGVIALENAADGSIIYISPAYEHVFGQKIETLLNDPTAFLKVIHPEDRERISKIFERETGPDARGEGYQTEYRIVHPDGEVRWIDSKGFPIRDRDGVVYRMAIVTEDITERKKVEEMKDNLIRDVSHELRTPLAKMQMSLELLLETLGKEEIYRQRAIDIGGMVFGNVRRLLQTVEAILDLSSLEAGRVSYERVEILLEDLMNEVLLFMQPVAKAKGLELVTELPEDLPPIEGDWDQLFRVLVNLVDNAIKFSEQGVIVISAEGAEREVRVAVKDTGCGIRPENLKGIFERFYQERARFHGAGVGLTICKRIVEAHGGEIWAESPGRGQGTTLRFTLPVTKVEEMGP